MIYTYIYIYIYIYKLRVRGGGGGGIQLHTFTTVRLYMFSRSCCAGINSVRLILCNLDIYFMKHAHRDNSATLTVSLRAILEKICILTGQTYFISRFGFPKLNATVPNFYVKNG